MVVRSQDSCIADQCRNLEFGPEKTFDGKRLINHTIRTVVVTVARFCENLCYMEPDCVSINLYTPADGNGNYECELNNVTHEGHEDRLIDREKYSYHAAESDCVQNPCKNNATCQSGFTKKGYRCLCTVGFEGPLCGKGVNLDSSEVEEIAKVVHSVECTGIRIRRVLFGMRGGGAAWSKYALSDERDDGRLLMQASIFVVMQETGPPALLPIREDEAITNVSGVVTLLVDSQLVSVFCHMGDFGCGDGGWTPVMKIDGSQTTFHYDADYWSNFDAFNLPGGETGFDEQESKLPTYWNTSFSKICLSSYNPTSHKATTIRTLTRRAQLVCDSTDSLSDENKYLHRVFTKNNYNNDFIRRNTHRPTTTTETNDTATPTTTATIPYIKGMSENISRILLPFNIRVAHKPITTLRQLLTNVKDKDEPRNRQGTIYKINCSDCQASYIGETGRNLTTRLTEHRRATRKGDVSNHIAEHHRLTNHNIDWDSAQCLTYSTDYFQRLTLESWFTNLEQTPLNRCQQLPAPYKRLIHDINITNDRKRTT
ncbi:hypothetical protein AWC38_SpisGene19441 [Stylophora pistillata]|uniref:EGF-like domain-containing protein n=1 Tax=Stylophora pistillata TaxID=50429 RepID=A0A2B4RIU4_STYPI|nr:hypothetical protein AWC38_SpisGene19441 [Stylophora pistillata]